MNLAGVERPQRASAWLLGSGYGVQVWTMTAHSSIRATLLMIRGEAPIIVLNQRIVGTSAEGETLAQAFDRIAEGTPGYSLLRA
jgi:hypothetical protein